MVDLCECPTPKDDHVITANINSAGRLVQCSGLPVLFVSVIVNAVSTVYLVACLHLISGRLRLLEQLVRLTVECIIGLL